ncbi:MAG: prolyl oligopeptidase family serine peptidase [Actinocatenispora sp.]
MRAFFRDDTFDFQTRLTLGATFGQGAEVGEVLATIERVQDGHADTWITAWEATAARLRDEAVRRRDAGHRRSAAAAYLRAARYFDTATYAAFGGEGEHLFNALWEDYRSCWDAFVDLGDRAVERVEIPYEDTTLPGYFLSAGPGRRRTLILVNGSDGSVVDMWMQGGLEGNARGWHVLIFDGPGQGAALVRQKLYFRPDWEHVVTPVVDYLAARRDVDRDRIAISGVSQGGYWVPRALAYEHRIAAGVADPGVLDVSTAMLDHLPHSMVKLLEQGQKTRFDKEMRLSARVSKKTAAMMAFRFHPYGLDSAFEVFKRAMEFSLSDREIDRIDTPLLVTDPEDEQFWPGQSVELHEKLPGRKTLISFGRRDGANFHCEPMAPGLRNERVFDWLDEVVPAD